MPIPASETTTVEAAYDLWAIFDFRVIGSGCVGFGAGGPPGPVSVSVGLVKYRLRDDGEGVVTPEMSPHPGDVRRLAIADLYAEAAVNEQWATVLGLLTQAVADYAAALGAL